MNNLLKMERYQLLRNRVYWFGMLGVFLIGFLTAETYVPEVMGPSGGAATSLTDIFIGMVYDSTFLLIFISSLIALIFGQEFSCRTLSQEVCAGHSRRQIFISKIVSYLAAFNLMALVYPVSGCIREFVRFGIAGSGLFLYNVSKAVLYSFLLNSAVFLIPILFCCCFQNAAKAVAVTAVVTFVLSLYLGYGLMLKLPVSFLPTFQIREAISMPGFLTVPAFLVAAVWTAALLSLSWGLFCKCDLK